MSEHELEPPLAPSGPERGAGGRFLPRATPSERTPERQRLAEAIEHHDRAIGRLARVREAFGRLRLDEAGASHEKARAEQDLAAIQERAPRMLVARLLGGQTEDAGAVEAAEAALATATRAVEDAEQARCCS